MRRAARRQLAVMNRLREAASAYQRISSLQ